MRYLLFLISLVGLDRWLLRRRAKPQETFAGQQWSGIVHRIIDGDTVDIVFEGAVVRVRLAHIDAPEAEQAFGPEASAWLQQAAASNTPVSVRPRQFDYYGRVVADLYIGGSWLNYWMVRAGLAWALPNDDEAKVAEAQLLAQEEKIGLWAAVHPTPPWVFRDEAVPSGPIRA